MKGDAAARRLASAPAEEEPSGRVVARLSGAEIPDAELVRRARDDRDRWAEEALFRRHVDAVYGMAQRLLRDRTDTEDVVQDTFITALGKLDQIHDPATVRAWLVTIAVRKVHRRFRRRKLRRALGLDRRFGDLGLDELAIRDAGPEVRSELRLLDQHLDRLPTSQRIAWMLRRVEGYSLEEAANACECSLATVKRRIAAADDRIRRHVRIEGDGGIDDGGRHE